MSVKIRGGKWHYRFYASEAIYSGLCKDCHNKKDAQAFEKAERDKVSSALDIAKTTKKAKKIIENVTSFVMGDAVFEKIPIEKAFELSCMKAKPREPGKEYNQQKRSHWRDFASFMGKEFKEVKLISDIQEKHANKYIGYIRKHGRYDKTVKSGGVCKEYKKKNNLSSASANLILTTLKETVKLLMKDAGIDENPFKDIKKSQGNAVSREVFTEKEIRNIFDNADEFLYPLFRIGLATAMREGDICLLKWSDVDFDNNMICKKTGKTGVKIEIPMLPWLYDYLLELKDKSNGSEYVLPLQAELYLQDRSIVSGRIITFLKSLKIVTKIKADGRDILVSNKDFHSLRHTFCYIAGLQRWPLLVVQSIVGHMSPEMTKHYQKHADMAEKRKALEQMPDFMRGGSPPPLLGSGDTKKEQIIKLMATATEKQLDKILTMLEG